jgi:hypothetical protein
LQITLRRASAEYPELEAPKMFKPLYCRGALASRNVEIELAFELATFSKILPDMDDASFSSGLKELVYENTYITGPEGYGDGARFQRHKVQTMLKQVLKDKMEKQKYDPVKGAQIAKQLADDLRERVKMLGYERYKLVVQVTIGQKTGQAMRIVSRCLWDTTTDNFASEYFENESLYCVCQVYGLYYE